MSTDKKVFNALKNAGKKGLTAEELARRVGSTAKDLRNAGYDYIYDAKQKNPKLGNKINKQWFPEEETYRYVLTGYDKDELYESITNTSKILKKDLQPREGKNVLLESDEPILLIIAGDLHLGHRYCDYEGIKEMANKISDIDNAYCINLGDIIDNSVNALSPGNTHNLANKNEQLDMVEYILDTIGAEKLLLNITGNHEQRSWNTDQFLPGKWIALKYQSNFGYYSTPFIIEIGDKKWEFFVRHKPSSGTTQYNPVRPSVKSVLFRGSALARDADILITGHTHTYGKGSWRVGGKKRWFLSIGATVDWDRYGESLGFITGEDNKISAIYLREDKEPLIYEDYKEAIEDWF